ncbi:hypothetical protein DFP78_104330 [Photobacterium lutimaris]|nr:hypothetical protein DFP78_104330 [Photobacterium lutimaris]
MCIVYSGVVIGVGGCEQLDHKLQYIVHWFSLYSSFFMQMSELLYVADLSDRVTRRAVGRMKSTRDEAHKTCYTSGTW